MNKETGSVSVSTENIFPIIRKWLYSDRDIFLRELVSNASDAISKLKRLTELGEAELPAGSDNYRIDVRFNNEDGTLSIEDNGIGMTSEEIHRYINQIAYSGVMDFVEKYESKGAEKDGIIGHFGLGFYSAFMVADEVRIDTMSWQPGAVAASWVSEDGINYTMAGSERQNRGSLITLKLSEEGREFLTANHIREILVKYCGFMAVPIYFHDDTPKPAETEAEKDKSTAAATTDTSTDASTEASPEPVEKPINNTSPLWLKNPREVTDEEYKQFYRDTFLDFREPLFWVHLNMDYPFHLKGILYFPRTENVYESLEGRIKIFYNQVFVADNVKEIIPEFLFLLKGTIDCPDLPLNVSRSFLQNDQYVSKLSGHIVRKVADKLNDLFKNNRSDYEGYWKDIAVFVKYGMMKDEKFYDRVKDSLIFETTEHEFKTLSDLGEKLAYTTDPERQVTYLQLAKDRGQDVVIMNHELDNHFMSFIEYKNPGVKFSRVDAEVGGETADDERKEALTDLFRKATGDDKLTVEVRSVGADALPAILVESEESRRMQEMRKQFQQMNTGDSEEKVDFDSLFPIERKLVINDDQALAGKLLALSQIPGSEDRASELAAQLFDLARLGHGSLAADDLAAFIKRSGTLLQELAEKE
ncbi:MAG: molecular chaperone HtpG [Saccharofermentanales bacterium]|jgi:molecular chaperone HtpG